MQTIHMGLNTEPDWIKADEIIERWKSQGNNEMVAYWEKSRVDTLKLRDQIIEVVERDGECGLSWSCDGRTRHQMHACQWAKAMPEYDFEIGYNYLCIVRKKKEE